MYEGQDPFRKEAGPLDDEEGRLPEDPAPTAAPAPAPALDPGDEVRRQKMATHKAQLRAEQGAYDQARRSNRSVGKARREGLRGVREMSETMGYVDAAQRRVAAAQLDVGAMLRDATRRIREDFAREQPEAPPQTNNRDVAIEGIRGLTQLGVAFFMGGGTKKILAKLSSLAPGLADALGDEGAEHEPGGEGDGGGAAPEAGAAPAAAPATAQAAPAPAGAVRLPELGVLYDLIPEEVARNLSIEDLKALTNLVAGLRAQGKVVNLDALAAMFGGAK